MNPRISIIAAMDEKRGIGRTNTLLFKIPEDFKRMKTLTTGHPIIMGRKTFESIGRILPERTNIIITRDPSYAVEGVVVVRSLGEAFEKAREKDREEVFIFGGGEVFKESLPVVDRLYLTLVEGDYQADTFFPDYSEFKKVIFKQKRQSDGYKYRFVVLEK